MRGIQGLGGIGGGGARWRGILDKVPGAAAAYSMRRLSSKYHGPCLRVRRSGDNAEKDIGFAGNKIDITDLLAFVGGENLLANSNDFNALDWVSLGASVEAGGSDPLGGNAAQIVTLGAPGAAYRQGVYVASPAAFTASVWVKAAPTASATHIRLTTNDTAAWDTGISQKVALTNEWQHVVVSGLTVIPSGQGYVLIGSVTDSGAGDPDCVGNVLIYNPQVNRGSSAAANRVTASMWKADAFAVTLYDQIGTAHATQGTAAIQPHAVLAGVMYDIEGAPALFSEWGSSRLLNFSAAALAEATAATGAWLYRAQQTPGTSTGAPVRLATASDHMHLPFIDGSAYDSFMSTVRMGFSPYPLPSDFNQHTSVQDGAALSVYRRGVFIGTQSVEFDSTPALSELMDPYYGDIRLSEAIVWGRVLTADEIQIVATNQIRFKDGRA